MKCTARRGAAGHARLLQRWLGTHRQWDRDGYEEGLIIVFPGVVQLAWCLCVPSWGVQRLPENFIDISRNVSERNV